MNERQVLCIPQGSYQAKITDYGIMQTKAGKAMVMVKLQVWENKELVHNMAWFGGLEKEIAPGKEKSSREWTIEALQKLNADLTLDRLVEKTQTEADDAKFIGTELSVEIANEPDSKTGILTSRVKYLNSSKKFRKLSAAMLASLRESDVKSEFDLTFP